MKSIPVLGTPIVNGIHWLFKQIASIDYPVDNYLVVNNNGKGELDEQLNNLAKISHPFIKNFKVVHMPSNIGCGGAWNLIIIFFVIVYFFKKDYLKVPGKISALFLIFYSLFRFFIEFFRSPDPQIGYLVLNLTLGQLISVLFFMTGIYLLSLKNEK